MRSFSIHSPLSGFIPKKAYSFVYFIWTKLFEYFTQSMIANLKSRLLAPFPFRFTLGSFLIPAAMVVGILFLFAPFGLNSMGVWNRLFVSLLFGLTTIIFASLVVFPLHYLRELNKWRSWKLWQEILLNTAVLFSIGIGNALCIGLLSPDVITSMNSIAYIVFLTAAFGVIPTLINSVYEQNQFLKKLQKISALRLSHKQLSRVDSANTPIEKQVDTGKLISIQNEKGETELRLKPEQLLYVASEGNYLDVFYLESNGEVQRRVVRNRLKRLISSFGELSLFAVHRSYAINLQHLREVKGNARAAKVYLHGLEDGLPIARSKFAEIKSLMDAI